MRDRGGVAGLDALPGWLRVARTGWLSRSGRVEPSPRSTATWSAAARAGSFVLLLGLPAADLLLELAAADFCLPEPVADFCLLEPAADFFLLEPAGVCLLRLPFGAMMER